MNSTPHPQDSLDNLSSLQVNRQRQLQAQVKQLFTKGLEKLQSPETREIGIAELKKLIEQYRDQQYLRGYIAILKTLKSNSNSATKEHQILVISILSQTYKQQLLDPIDKPPSLLKTSFRLVQILHGYFNDQSPTVQQACARALLDLNTYCLFEQTIQTIFSIIFAPLISTLKSGVDKGAQATASACLSQLINYNRRVGKEELLQRLSPEMLSVLLKVNSEYHQLFQAILGMIESQGLNFLEGRLVNVLAKILSVIDGTREVHSVNTTNLNAYMCKVNVCKIIEKIAKLLPSAERDKLTELRIQQALQQAARHRIIQVQMAASKALKAWRGEETEVSPQKGKRLTSLEQKRNNKKLERSKSREDRIKAENQLTFMKEDLQKLVKGGWGASNRAKNYVKRGTGVGGGYIGHTEVSPQSRSKSGGKSHKEHFEELREFIKKGVQQNKNIQRFSGIAGEIDKKSPSPPRSKSPTGRFPSKQESKKKLAQNQGDEVGFVEDDGQQMVFQPKKPSVEKLRSLNSGEFQHKGNTQNQKNRFDDIGISEAQARQLAQHEQSLLEQEHRMDINFSQSYEENNKIKKKASKINDRDAFQGEYTEFHQGGSIYTPQQQQPTSRNDIPPVFKNLTSKELGELVEQHNLSQVSQNLDDILNESDIKEFNAPIQNILVDSRILQSQDGKSEKGVLKQMVADKKERKSAVGKFWKKQQPIQNVIELKSSIPQAAQFKQAPKYVPAQLPTQSPLKSNLEQHGQSLNFTESLQSKVKSPPRKEDHQFTLNPKERFSSVVKQQFNEHEKQIQQQIAMSQYEESFPTDQPLPLILPKVAPITQIPLKHLLVPSKIERKKEPEPQNNIDYQKFIKNPPKLASQIQQSRLKKSKASEKSLPLKSNIEEKQGQNEDIGESWLNILNLIHEGQINQAYESTLNLDDPIYLLRLMLLNKLSLRQLSADTIQKLWSTFLQIYSQKFIDVLTVGVLTESNELGLVSKCLSVQELQEAMLGLYELSGSSKGKLSYKAATLYNDIQKKLHSE